MSGKTGPFHGAPCKASEVFVTNIFKNWDALIFYQKCSKVNTFLKSEQAEYAVNWSPRVDLFQVSGPRGGYSPSTPPGWPVL